MPSPEKIKGNNFEREVVNLAKKEGISAKRAYASDGRSLGQTENVDVLIDGFRGQCKRRKKLGKLYKIEDGCDIQIFKEDKGDILVMLKYEDFLKLIRR